MKGRILLILLAAARQAYAQAPALAEADSRIGRAAAIVEDLETRAARWLNGTRDPVAACVASFTVESQLSGLPPPDYAEYGPTLYSYNRDLLNHYLYKAAQAGDASQCAPLKAVAQEYDKKPSTVDRQCLEWAHRLLMARALVQGSPDFPRLCRNHLEYGDPALAAQAPAVCAIMLETRDDPKAMCARLDSHLKSSESRQDCAKNAGQYSGDADSCAKNDDDDVKTQCLATAAYHKALRAKDAGACGKSLWCRFMMGDPGSLASAERKMASDICGGAKALLATEVRGKGPEILALLRDAKRRLVDAEAATPVMALPAGQAVDLRLEKAARLGERYRTLAARLSPGR